MLVWIKKKKNFSDMFFIIVYKIYIYRKVKFKNLKRVMRNIKDSSYGYVNVG